MYAVLGSLVDVLHAVFMIAWVVGIPLLFWHRWPRLTKAYAVYALVFVVLNKVSKLMLDECFLTSIARYFWEAGAPPGNKPVDEWFTVRFAKTVFHLTPSHQAITIAGEVLVVLTALGMLRSARHFKRQPSSRVLDVSDKRT